MRRAALCILGAALVAAVHCGDSNQARIGDEDVDGDEENDGAPFAIVVSHDDGRRCGGSLVSMRTALTSAWCASARSGAKAIGRSLWALAVTTAGVNAPSHPDGVRQITRVAVAYDGVAQENPRLVEENGWYGALFDLALVEMESPFGKEANVRPILMATTTSDCLSGAQCTVVRILVSASSGSGNRLHTVRVVDAQIEPQDVCAAAQRHWAAVRETALCLRGAQLCRSDRGAGIVCGGKLCGVLSRSTDEGSGCGHTHAALSTARWRNFLRCAHTLDTCGRDDCAQLCIERNLIPTDSRPTQSETIATPPHRTKDAVDVTEVVPAAPALRQETITGVATLSSVRSSYAVSLTDDADFRQSSNMVPTRTIVSFPYEMPTGGRRVAGRNRVRVGSSKRPSARLSVRPSARPSARTSVRSYAGPSARFSADPSARLLTRTRPTSPPTALSHADSYLPLRPSLDWEPNRADFKAGEYGDNAAEYGDWELAADDASGVSGGPTRTSSSATTHALVRLVGAAAPQTTATHATAPPPSAPQPRADCSPRASALLPLFLLTLFIFYEHVLRI